MQSADLNRETKTLQFSNPKLIRQMFAGDEANLSKIEEAFGVEIASRDDWIKIAGEPVAVQTVADLFAALEAARGQGLLIKQHDFSRFLEGARGGKLNELRELFEEPLTIRLKRKSIVPKTVNQKKYLKSIRDHDIAFGVGPAGTGKTYLAMATALESLSEGRVEKLILTRPAVEAGEALGFLPGDLQEKILPYLRPLYDALYDMVGFEETQRMMEKGIIEIAPLAYMRGRTLAHSFVILDEAQNTTPEQMMMFLTRLGDDSRMVVTGDITQVDLPRTKKSGLKQAVQVLEGIEGISIFFFDETDVVRHPLVQKVVKAYEAHFEEISEGHW